MEYSLHIDFESYSEADLIKLGAWAYSMHPSTEVLMMAWAFNDDAPKLWLPGEPLPKWVSYLHKAQLPFRIHAWNDFFEMSIFENVLNWPVPSEEYWTDVAASAAALSLPRSLAECGKVLNMPSNKQKDSKGHDLIKTFSIPKKTKDGIVRTYPKDKPKEFEEFKMYCLKDVIAERYIYKKLKALSPINRKTWELDRKINRRGVYFDIQAVKDAIHIREIAATKRIEKVKQITNGELSNVKSPSQFISYMRRLGLSCENSQKEYLKRKITTLKQCINDKEFFKREQAIAQKELLEKVKEAEQKTIKKGWDKKKYIQVGSKKVLRTKEFLTKTYKANRLNADTINSVIDIITARISVAKSALAKYDKVLEIAFDCLAYGLLRFHGANTGRWSGNLFQPHNLQRPSFENIHLCAELFKYKDDNLLDLIYGDALEALGSSIRSVITVPKNEILYVSDFSQIESRGLKWLAHDEKGLSIYREGKDIYKFNAAAAFNVNYEDVTKDQRTIGKVIELACGYQGALGAFKNFADVYGVVIPDEKALKLIKSWRSANKKIVNFWYDLESAIIAAVDSPGKVFKINDLKFKVSGSGHYQFLFCLLPSGRLMAYHRPGISTSGRRRQAHYYGVDSKTHKYCKQKLYGGKIAQNVTEGISYDRLCFSMHKVEEAGYKIILTVHDEIICRNKNSFGSIEEFNSIMCINPNWCKSLPIEVDGYAAKRYRK